MNASKASFESNKVVFVPNMVVTIVDLLMWRRSTRFHWRPTPFLVRLCSASKPFLHVVKVFPIIIMDTPERRILDQTNSSSSQIWSSQSSIYWCEPLNSINSILVRFCPTVFEIIISKSFVEIFCRKCGIRAVHDFDCCLSSRFSLRYCCCFVRDAHRRCWDVVQVVVAAARVAHTRTYRQPAHQHTAQLQ